MLQRNFGLVSLVAFSTTLIASWESIAWYVSLDNIEWLEIMRLNIV